MPSIDGAAGPCSAPRSPHSSGSGLGVLLQAGASQHSKVSAPLSGGGAERRGAQHCSWAAPSPRPGPAPAWPAQPAASGVGSAQWAWRPRPPRRTGRQIAAAWHAPGFLSRAEMSGSVSERPRASGPTGRHRTLVPSNRPDAPSSAGSSSGLPAPRAGAWGGPQSPQGGAHPPHSQGQPPRHASLPRSGLGAEA